MAKFRATEDKLVSWEEAKTIRECLRSDNKTVVFTNGCFDIIHVGHVRCLNAAKEEGDILIVGLNSDLSVRNLKGEGRPILDQSERIKLLSAFSSVDYIVLFDEPSADKLIEWLCPDVHAKGTDYTQQTVPERELADRLGIRIAIVGDQKTHSTKSLIEKIKAIANAN